MAKLHAIALAIWFVVAVFATQPVRSGFFDIFISKAEFAKKRLLGEEEMSIDDIKKELANAMEDEQVRKEEIIWWTLFRPEISISDLHDMAKEDVRDCHIDFLSKFKSYTRDAEEYPNVKKFFEYLYEPKLKLCKDLVLSEVKKFKVKKSGEEKTVEEFYNAIKGNEQLDGKLTDYAGQMKEEMMSALADVLKAKSPDVDEDYETTALKIIRQACKGIEPRYEFHKAVDVVRKLSPKIMEEEEELADYIGQLRLCKLAQTHSKVERDAYLNLKKKISDLTEEMCQLEHKTRKLISDKSEEKRQLESELQKYRW